MVRMLHFYALLLFAIFAAVSCAQPSIVGVWDNEPKSKFEDSIEFRSNGTFSGVHVMEDKKHPGVLLRGYTSGKFSISGSELTQTIESLKIVREEVKTKKSIIVMEKTSKTSEVAKLRFSGNDRVHTSFRTKDGFEIEGLMSRRQRP